MWNAPTEIRRLYLFRKEKKHVLLKERIELLIIEKRWCHIIVENDIFGNVVDYCVLLLYTLPPEQHTD